MEAAAEMRNRYFLNFTETENKPKLILVANKANFYDITIDDFIMLNYEPIKPQLKLEIGI